MSDQQEVHKKFNDALRSKAQRDIHGRNAASKLAAVARRADRSGAESPRTNQRGSETQRKTKSPA
jgi:hypothetical protein